MFCINCGAKIPAGMAFCEQCGQPVRKRQDPNGAQNRRYDRPARTARHSEYGQSGRLTQERRQAEPARRAREYRSGSPARSAREYRSEPPARGTGSCRYEQSYAAAPQTAPALTQIGRFSAPALLTVQAAAGVYLAIANGIVLHNLTMLAGGTYQGSMKISAVFCLVIMLLCFAGSIACGAVTIDANLKNGRRDLTALIDDPHLAAAALPVLTSLMSLPALFTAAEFLMAVYWKSKLACILLSNTYNGFGMGIRIFALQACFAAAITAFAAARDFRLQAKKKQARKYPAGAGVMYAR